MGMHLTGTLVVLLVASVPLASPATAEEPAYEWRCDEGIVTATVLDMRDMLLKEVNCITQTVSSVGWAAPGLHNFCAGVNNIGDAVGFCNWNEVDRFFGTDAISAYRMVRAIWVGELYWNVCRTSPNFPENFPACGQSPPWGDYLIPTVGVALHGLSTSAPACVTENSQEIRFHPAAGDGSLLMDQADAMCA